MFEVTDRERLYWQLQAVRVLEKLLKQANRDDLPAIAWSINHANASLLGECFGRRSADRRIQFEKWQVALGAVASPERNGRGGVVHLSAVKRRYDGLVDVVLRADLFPEKEGPST